MLFARDWLSTSIEEFLAAVDACIRWYNEVRIKISLGLRCPAEHSRRLGIAA
jgi:transposase InsO family protein